MTVAPARRRAGLAAGALACALALRAAPARAAGPPPAPDLRLASIFQYQADPGAHPVRAALEIGAGLAYQFTVYLSSPSPTAVAGGRTWSPADKLFRGAVTFDGNGEVTNFVGHPLSGLFYYQVARGNRLSPAAASLTAVVASAAWELTEFHETASLNDQLVTPAAGIALGEPLTQLAAFFEQRDAGGGDRLLAWLLNPWKPAHDWWDGARRVRRPGALAAADLRLAAATGGVRRGAAWDPVVRAGLAAALVRGASWGEPGRGSQALLDGNAVRLSLSAAASPRGLEGLQVESEALLAAVAWRDLEAPGPEGGPPTGQDLLAGAGIAFEHGLQRVAADGRLDWRSLVQAPALRLAWRRAEAAWGLTASLSAGLAFGGVRSLVLAGDAAAVAPADLPTVARAYGYFFAWGPALRPALALRLGTVTLAAEGRLDLLTGITARDPAPVPGGHPVALEERRAEGRAALGWQPAGPRGPALGLEAGWTWRRGRAGDLAREAAVTEALATVGLAR